MVAPFDNSHTKPHIKSHRIELLQHGMIKLWAHRVLIATQHIVFHELIARHDIIKTGIKLRYSLFIEELPKCLQCQRQVLLFEKL